MDIPVDDELKAVAFLCEERMIDGRSRRVPVATAFFVDVPEGAEYHYIYAVTARHVVEDAGDTLYLRVNKSDGGFREIAIPRDHWECHDAADVAAVLFTPTPEQAVGLLGARIPLAIFVGADYNFNGPPFPSTMKIPTKIGQEVFYVGLFTEAYQGVEKGLEKDRRKIAQGVRWHRRDTQGGEPMRGDTTQQLEMLSPVTPDTLVPCDHPIREIRTIVDRALDELSPVFDAMYAADGRPSVPPEHLLKAMLLQAFYSIRSERQLCERLQYDLLFKWFLGLNIGDQAFDHSTFSKNRDRLLEQDVATHFFLAVRREAQRRHLLSSEHFTVDGTLLEAWASMKSVRPRGDDQPRPGGKNPSVDFRGQRRANATHASTTDPEARLARKGDGQASTLAYAGHVLMENRNGLIVDITLTPAGGHAERAAALALLDRLVGDGRITLGADKGYDTADFIEGCRERHVTPHVAQHTTGRRSRIDGRVTRHAGYAVSQRLRKRVEEIFGWIKTVGGGRKLRYIGLARNQLWATLTGAAFNLIRMVRIEQQAA